MDNILKGLRKKQLEFMSIECGVSVEEIKKADDSESDELSERGKMAENIVTIIGNNIRDKKGLK